MSRIAAVILLPDGMVQALDNNGRQIPTCCGRWEAKWFLIYGMSDDNTVWYKYGAAVEMANMTGLNVRPLRRQSWFGRLVLHLGFGKVAA